MSFSVLLTKGSEKSLVTVTTYKELEDMLVVGTISSPETSLFYGAPFNEYVFYASALGLSKVFPTLSLVNKGTASFLNLYNMNPLDGPALKLCFDLESAGLLDNAVVKSILSLTQGVPSVSPVPYKTYGDLTSYRKFSLVYFLLEGGFDSIINDNHSILKNNYCSIEKCKTLIKLVEELNVLLTS